MSSPRRPAYRAWCSSSSTNWFSDNQLDECPLTLKDLHNIARSFNKILNGIYHHRWNIRTNCSPEHSTDPPDRPWR
ncbi:MAG: hypothetical protein R2860_07240 [Desulfobacterales bacterium]